MLRLGVGSVITADPSFRQETMGFGRLDDMFLQKVAQFFDLFQICRCLFKLLLRCRACTRKSLRVSRIWCF